ncbi:MAG: 30S ribosomal protein S8e [Nanoarchaeota archaeon]|nr:30S ribosomal protein S8e [Nanoarchaeota archaeon]
MKKGIKTTGGKYHKQRKKKKYESGRIPRIVKLGKEKRKKIKTRGGNEKIVLLSTDIASIINSKTKTAHKTKIKNVIETPSNRFLARQNILMKGAIIETELGKAKITNRPGQEGSVQGILIEEQG